MLTSDGEDTRLVRVDDRFETVGAISAEIGNRKRDRPKIALQQPARTSALDCVMPRLSDLAK